MRFNIEQQTPNILKMSLKPDSIWYWLFGSIFIAGGVFLISSLGKATTFSCNRLNSTQGSCQLSTNALLKSQVKNWHIQDVQGAKLDTDDTDSWSTYPLVLLTKSGAVIIDLVNADSTQKEAKAAEINRIIQNNQAGKVTIKEDSRLWTYPLGLLLIGSGAICIIYALINGKIICVLDKHLNQITIERQGFFGKGIEAAKLSDIVEINVDAFTVDSASSYNVVLYLAAENKLYLANGHMFTAKSAEQTVNAIANFLNLATFTISN